MCTQVTASINESKEMYAVKTRWFHKLHVLPVQYSAAIVLVHCIEPLFFHGHITILITLISMRMLPL